MLAESRTRRLASSAHRCVWTPWYNTEELKRPGKGPESVQQCRLDTPQRSVFPATTVFSKLTDESATVLKAIGLLPGVEPPARDCSGATHTIGFWLMHHFDTYMSGML